MNLLVYLVYPLILVFLFLGAKMYGKKEWNAECMSLRQTKAIQGFCAVCIMLHHIGQRTCAPWLPGEFKVHGLDPFVNIGYLFVAVFLFCSGYGLFKSVKTKPDYLKNFLPRRFLPLCIAFLVSSVIFMVVTHFMGITLWLPQLFFRLSGPNLYNSYGWYMVAILIFYLGFYFAFKKCKTERMALLVTCAVVLYYIIHCYLWVFGGWWFNAVPLFCIGMFFARQEERIIRELKRHYVIYLPVTLLLTIVCHFFAEYLYPIKDSFEGAAHFDLYRCGVILFQMMAATCFVLFLLLIGLKVRIGNRYLAFMGSITLEFYLIHGLYVQLFGYSYLLNPVSSLFYIKNVAMYTLVVLILAIPTAWLMQKVDKYLTEFFIKVKDYVARIVKDIRKLMLILLILVAAVTLISVFMTQSRKKELMKSVTAYAEDIITYANVDGEQMAAYVTGEGEHTVVLLRGMNDPCASVTMKPIADDLARYNRVVILDYFGSGFSDDTKQERTAERMVYEIHTALSALGEEGPYILMPYEMSGIYAQLYTELYPKEVEAVIGVEVSVPEYLREYFAVNGTSIGEYQKISQKSARITYLEQRFLEYSGFASIQWGLINSLFYHTHTREELNILEEKFMDCYYSRNTAVEMARAFESYQSVWNQKYPKELPVLFLLGSGSCEKDEESFEPYIDWEQVHLDTLSGGKLQKVEKVPGGDYIVYYNSKAVASQAQKFIETLQ